ncbi:YvrJ family protein [Metasolibacillus sp. FSL H7-0170]|uniref:YvrJ family protein n=1 Tax=Metasolibacillus sp. FSL H7-0170 TaxID=2921431 RepID=UPI003158670A
MFPSLLSIQNIFLLRLTFRNEKSLYITSSFSERSIHMTDYTNLINLISNVGFPILIAFYLLHRFEQKLDTLIDNISILSQVIEKQQQKK